MLCLKLLDFFLLVSSTVSGNIISHYVVAKTETLDVILYISEIRTDHRLCEIEVFSLISLI